MKSAILSIATNDDNRVTIQPSSPSEVHSSKVIQEFPRIL
jgi:hypothetical protein